MNGRIRYLGVLATSVVLTGCAAPAGGGPFFPAPNYLGSITEDAEFPNAGISLQVPSSVKVGVTPAEAYSTCDNGDAICDPERRPTIFLAEATVTGTGEEQPDGSIKPLVDHTLVYVIQYVDVPCMPAGPYSPPPSGSASTASPVGAPTTYLCMIINLVDAASGDVLYSVQGPDLGGAAIG